MSRKTESWNIATMLYWEKRISLAMALWALKESGHTVEEAELFLSKEKPEYKVPARRGREVRCIETGKVYRTLVDAGKEIGLLGRSAISHAIKKGFRAGGYHWEFV